ncbi:peptidase S1 and S6 chymotrypsin/Hap, partial [Reticulomyxa filosa]
ENNEREEFDYEIFRTQFRRQMKEENYEECERLCRSAIGKNLPNLLRAKVYNCLGYLYENCMEDKLFDDILEKYVLSLQLDNDNANAHYNLGNFLVEQGIQHLAQAIQLNPTHDKALSLFESLQNGIAGGRV